MMTMNNNEISQKIFATVIINGSQGDQFVWIIWTIKYETKYSRMVQTTGKLVSSSLKNKWKIQFCQLLFLKTFKTLTSYDRETVLPWNVCNSEKVNPLQVTDLVKSSHT